MFKKKILLISMMLTILTLSVSGVGNSSIDPYQNAIQRLIVPYLKAQVSARVKKGDNVAAQYSMEMWTKGDQISSAIIYDSPAEFMIGVAFLEKGNNEGMVIWWPAIETAKTYTFSKGREQLGFGGGKLDKVIWNQDDYSPELIEEDNKFWKYEIIPKSEVEDITFGKGLIRINKESETITQAKFWNSQGELVEVTQVTGYQEFTTESGNTVIYPQKYITEEPEENRITTMEYLELEFPESIDGQVFTLEFLKEESASVMKNSN